MSSLAYAALCLFVFTMPWERLISFSGIYLITRVTGVIAIGLTLLTVLLSGRLRRWRGFHVFALAFVIWAGVSVMILHMDEIPGKLYTFVQLVLAAWMIWELATTRERVIGLFAAYVIGAYIAALETILLYRRAAGELRRFSAGGQDPNSLAMILALALPMAWYLGMVHRRPLVQWLCRAYVPAAIFAIALTGSRGGMIACFFALLVVPLTMTNLSPGKMVAGIAMLAIAGALAVAYVPQTVVERLATTGESVSDLSLGGRFKLWQAGLHAFTYRPIMGYGTSAYKSAIYAEMGPMTQVAHNSFISVLVEEGIVGLLLYLAMQGYIFFSILRLPRLERRFALVLFGTLIVAMLPLTWEDEKAAWLVMAMLMGLSYAPFGAAAVQPAFARAAATFRRAPAAAHLRQRMMPGRGARRDGSS